MIVTPEQLELGWKSFIEKFPHRVDHEQEVKSEWLEDHVFGMPALVHTKWYARSGYSTYDPEWSDGDSKVLTSIDLFGDHMQQQPGVWSHEENW